MRRKEEYPGQVDGPAFSMNKAMHNGLPTLQAASFAQLWHETWRHQLHLEIFDYHVDI